MHYQSINDKQGCHLQCLLIITHGIEEAIVENTADKLPPNLTYEVGYIEKDNANRWIEASLDLMVTSI